jgi:hypothetical protein
MIAFVVILTLAIVVSGKFLNTVLELLQEALSDSDVIEFSYLSIHKSIDGSIYKEERFKGAKGTNPLSPLTVADY